MMSINSFGEKPYMMKRRILEGTIFYDFFLSIEQSTLRELTRRYKCNMDVIIIVFVVAAVEIAKPDRRS